MWLQNQWMQLHHLFDRKEWSWTWISWGGDEAGCQRWKVAQKEWYVFFSGNNVILMSIDCAQETWYLCILLFAARLAQWWERSPPTSVARVRFPDPASYVGWVCWFSILLREVFLWVLRFSPLLKNQHFQIPNRSGNARTCSKRVLENSSVLRG